jgi:hypothetical protein
LEEAVAFLALRPIPTGKLPGVLAKLSGSMFWQENYYGKFAAI